MATQQIEVRVVDKTQAALGKINAGLGRVEQRAKSVDNTFRSIAGLAASVFAGLGLSRVASGVIQVSRRFEDLRAQLKTVTGSVRNANIAFNEIEKFASTTPFNLDEVVESFIILRRFGLDATSESLKAFGNIAAANNKSFTQFGEAVADALTGEFERLKEFGIKVRNENGQFVAALGNQQLGVANSTTELIDLIKQLGEEGGQFATGIEDRAATLSGALSNLNDATNKFQSAIGEGGLSAATRDLVKTFTELIAGSQNLATSIGERLGFVVFRFNEFIKESNFNMGNFIKGAQIAAAVLGGAGLIKVLQGVTGAVKALTLAMARNPLGLIAVAAASAITYLSMENGLGRTIAQVTGVFKKLGEMASGVAQYFRDSLARVIDYLVGVFDRFIETIQRGYNAVARFVPFLDEIEVNGAKAREALKQLAVDGFNAVTDTVIETGKSIAESTGLMELASKASEEANSIISELTEAYRAAGLSFDESRQKAEEQYLAFRQMNSVADETIVTADDIAAAMSGASDGTDQLTKSVQTFVDNLKAGTAKSSLTGLYQQLKDVEDAYKSMPNAVEGWSSANDEFFSKEAQQFEEQLILYEQFENTRFEIYQKYLKAKGDALEKSLMRGVIQEKQSLNEIIAARNSGLFQEIGNQERQAKIVKDRIEFEKKSETEKVQFGLEQATTLFTGLSKVNKKFFAAQKAAAIALAIVNTYQGATKALATYPPPFNFIAAAATVASGLAQVATIRAQTMQRGGALAGGQSAIVGEDGPELIVPKQSSTVIPREVADAVNNLGGGKQDVTVNFNITTVDAASFDQLLVERRGTIVGLINQAVEKRGRQGVV